MADKVSEVGGGAYSRRLRDMGDGTYAEVVASADAGPAWASVWGVANAPVISADMSAAAVAVTDAPATGQKLVIDDVDVSAEAAMRLTFTEETSGTVMLYVRVTANGNVQKTLRGKRKLAVAGKRLLCQSDAEGDVEVLVGYHWEL